MAGYAAAGRLTNAATLDAVRHAFQGDLESFAPPADPDPRLVALVERPFESTADVSERLSQLGARLRDREDRRAVFLTVYVRMTQAVHAGI